MTLPVAAALFLLLQAPAQQTQQTPQAQQPPKGSIEGFVVRAGTNEPLARARITVNRTAGVGGAPVQPTANPTMPPVNADGQGHFLIKDLDPGSYRIYAGRNGFARQEYGERAPGRPGTIINIAAGQAIKDLVFRLIPAGSVSGRVSDATGEPLPGISVQLLRSSYDPNGKRTFQNAGAARTNDRGEYRFYFITPGRYFVNASGARSVLDIVSVIGGNNEVIDPGYATTYYPGTADPTTAASIEVQPGAELSAIDFTLYQQQLFRIRGRVFDSRTGGFPRQASVSIFPRSPQAGLLTSSSGGQSYNPSNGTFELRDVAPGSYWIRALSLLDPATGVQVDSGRNSAQEAVDVSNNDVENLVLTFGTGFSIPGRLSAEQGVSLSSLPNGDRIRVILTPTGTGANAPAPGTPVAAADGTFTLAGVPSGDYRVVVVPMPADYFVKSARLGQDNALSGFSIAGPVSGGLDIVLSANAGRIDGTIVDKDRKPVTGIQGVLIPEQRDRRDLYKTATTDQTGHFNIRTVPPGDYKFFAWEDLEPFAYNDPDFLRRYEERGTPVKISESSALTIEAKIIPAGQ